MEAHDSRRDVFQADEAVAASSPAPSPASPHSSLDETSAHMCRPTDASTPQSQAALETRMGISPTHTPTTDDHHQQTRTCPSRACKCLNSTTACCTDVLSINSLSTVPRDGWILFATRALRLFSFGFVAVILALHLTEMGFTEAQVGQLFALTFLGDALLSLYMTSTADRVGRRRMLVVGAVLKILTGLVFALCTDFWVLVIAGTLGVISPAGKEMGPFLAIEQAALAQTVCDEQRTRLFAWHEVCGSVSSALGSLVCGLVVTYLTQGPMRMTKLQAYNVMMVAYSVCGAISLVLFMYVSDQVELPPSQRHRRLPVSSRSWLGLHESKWIVFRLSLLFMLDAFAGALIVQSFVATWFVAEFGTGDDILGTMTFACSFSAGVSALFAAKLAQFIGLIRTMVVTHVPSNVLTVLIPLMPNEALAILVLCLRFSISQMDVPTRRSYVMAVVNETERSAAGGVTNVVRGLASAAAPYLAGLLYERASTRDWPFYLCGSMKIVYDVLILVSFASLKPPEEKTEEEQKMDALKAMEKAERGRDDEELGWDKCDKPDHGGEHKLDECFKAVGDVEMPRRVSVVASPPVCAESKPTLSPEVEKLTMSPAGSQR